MTVTKKSNYKIIILNIQKYLHTSTDYAVTGWMLCIVTHIREDFFNHSNEYHSNQVNTDIKTMLADSSEKYLHETIDLF